MKKGNSKPLTAKQRAELDALAALQDDKIDTREMPEVRAGPAPSAVCSIGQSNSNSRCGSTRMWWRGSRTMRRTAKAIRPISLVRCGNTSSGTKADARQANELQKIRSVR